MIKTFQGIFGKATVDLSLVPPKLNSVEAHVSRPWLEGVTRDLLVLLHSKAPAAPKTFDLGETKVTVTLED